MLTLADLREITGAKTRSLQVWTDATVLWAEAATNRQGRGVHRQYRDEEGIIALTVNELARYDMPVGALLGAANALRMQLYPHLLFAADVHSDVRSIQIDDGVVFTICARLAAFDGLPSYLVFRLSTDEKRFNVAFAAFDGEARQTVNTIVGKDIEWPDFDSLMNYTYVGQRIWERAPSAIFVDLAKVLRPFGDFFAKR